jgi:hypothetical protein
MGSLIFSSNLGGRYKRVYRFVTARHFDGVMMAMRVTKRAMGMASHLRSKVPVLEKYKDKEVDMGRLFYIGEDVNDGEWLYVYDIRRAYLSILRQFIGDDTYKKYYKMNSDFVMAVGMLASSYKLIDTYNSVVVEEKPPVRPDILCFCIDVLYNLYNYLKSLNVVWFYVDEFGFREELDRSFLEKFINSYSKSFNVSFSIKGPEMMRVTRENRVLEVGGRVFFALSNFDYVEI